MPSPLDIFAARQQTEVSRPSAVSTQKSYTERADRNYSSTDKAPEKSFSSHLDKQLNETSRQNQTTQPSSNEAAQQSTSINDNNAANNDNIPQNIVANNIIEDTSSLETGEMAVLLKSNNSDIALQDNAAPDGEESLISSSVASTDQPVIQQPNQEETSTDQKSSQTSQDAIITLDSMKPLSMNETPDVKNAQNDPAKSPAINENISFSSADVTEETASDQFTLAPDDEVAATEINLTALSETESNSEILPAVTVPEDAAIIIPLEGKAEAADTKSAVQIATSSTQNGALPLPNENLTQKPNTPSAPIEADAATDDLKEDILLSEISSKQQIPTQNTSVSESAVNESAKAAVIENKDISSKDKKSTSKTSTSSVSSVSNIINSNVSNTVTSSTTASLSSTSLQTSMAQISTAPTTAPLPTASLPTVEGSGFNAQMLNSLQGKEAVVSKAEITATPKMINDQITVAISKTSAATENMRNFTIQLKPADLGQVEIRMEFLNDGKIQTMVTVDNEKTLQLLQKDQSMLEKTLKDAGYDSSDSNLSFSLKQQDKENNQSRFADSSEGADSDEMIESSLAAAEIMQALPDNIRAQLSAGSLDINV